MLEVIKVIDLDFNNTGAYSEYFKKAKTGQIISEEEQAIFEMEGITFKIVSEIILHD